MLDGCHLILIDVLELWRNANVVCFDVDGTVCLGDGLNDLAEFCGEGKAVAEWTSRLHVPRLFRTTTIGLVLMPMPDSCFGFC